MKLFANILLYYCRFTLTDFFGIKNSLFILLFIETLVPYKKKVYKLEVHSLAFSFQ